MGRQTSEGWAAVSTACLRYSLRTITDDSGGGGTDGGSFHLASLLPPVILPASSCPPPLPPPSDLISLCLQTKNRTQCGANNVASVKFRILELGPLFRLFLQHHGSRFVVLDRSRLSERAHRVTLSVSLTQSSPPVAPVLQAEYRKQGRKETLIYCI